MSQIRERQFTIIVTGDFNRGKSTLLNAMIGRDLLFTRAVPIYKPSYLVRYGAVESVILHFSDGTARYVTTEDLFHFYLGDDIHDSSPIVLIVQVRLVEILTPAHLLRNGIEFVEVKSTNETSFHFVKEFFYKSCVVLYLVDATCPVTQEDRDALDLVSSYAPMPVFFAINKWNLLQDMILEPAELEECEKLIRARLAKYTTLNGVDLFDERVFKIDANRVQNSHIMLSGFGYPGKIECSGLGAGS